MNRISKDHQTVDALIFYNNPMATDEEVPFQFVWVGRLDGGNFKRWVGIRGHRAHGNN
jgi:hypothetical protein